MQKALSAFSLKPPPHPTPNTQIHMRMAMKNRPFWRASPHSSIALMLRVMQYSTQPLMQQ